MRVIHGMMVLATLGVIASSAAGQDVAASDFEFQLSREDSIALLRAARSDQAAFERLRRRLLPETWSRSGGYCDERIGRFCLTHSRGRDDWEAPPEDEEVVEARLRLIEDFGGAAGLLPGDGWIIGQRIRYLVEARRFDDAAAAAAECRAERWWCAALAGFALHYAARPLLADSAFDDALASMDEDQRKRWTDLSLILDDRSVRTYRRLGGEDRERFEERFWRLADPLLTRPGNELRSEHFARHVWDALQDRAQSTDGISWGFDLREIVIRYGWPAGWERVRSPVLTLGSNLGPPPMVTHYSSAPQYLLPPANALLDETGTGGVWDEEVHRSRTGYNVPLADSVARWFTPLAHQVAVFRRPDSAIVVAGYELPADSVDADAEIEAALGVIPTIDIHEEPSVAFAESASVAGSIAVGTEARPMLMTLEVIVPEIRRIARARYGIEIAPVQPGLLALSDLLLLRGGEELPDSLPDAIAAARGSSALRSGEEVGVYWEMYGVDPETTPELSMSLRLLERQTGWLRRLAERIGVVREIAPIRLRWDESVARTPYLARSLSIQIPPEVSDGAYTLELTVEAPAREALTVRRDIDIIAPGR